MGEIGLTNLERQIEKAEKELNSRQQALEKAKEKIIKADREKRLKSKNIKDLTYDELDTLKEDGVIPDGFSKPAGYIPDLSDIYSKILSNLKEIVRMRGFQIPDLKPMSSLSDVKENIFAVRDSLKQQIEPDIPVEYNEDEFSSYGDVFEKSDKPHIIQTHVDCTTMAPGEYCESLSDGTWRVRKSKSYQPEYTKAELIAARDEINRMLRSYP